MVHQLAQDQERGSEALARRQAVTGGGVAERCRREALEQLFDRVERERVRYAGRIGHFAQRGAVRLQYRIARQPLAHAHHFVFDAIDRALQFSGRRRIVAEERFGGPRRPERQLHDVARGA